jgi:stage IV sporulation protein FB
VDPRLQLRVERRNRSMNTLLFVVLLFLCVLLHEFGHIFTARAFGVPTPYVTLLPIGGIAQLERIPEEAWEEFLIALAGPAVNVVIAAALIVFAHAHPRATATIGVEDMQIPMVDRLAAVNLPACTAAASKAG